MTGEYGPGVALCNTSPVTTTVGADSPPSTGTGRRAVIQLKAPAALGWCIVPETRLDTARIRAARRVIDPVFLDTPLYRCEALEPGLGCAVSIKLETANPVRSFKARGTEVVASLLASTGSRAVVCASAGNLGQALAWSGRGRGLDVTVVASRFAPAAKLDRIRALGARLELVDGDFDVARERAAAIARHHGIRLVEDSLDIETCEGAATIGLELTGRGLVNTETSFDAVLIALGGGALATGVGHVVKARAPEVEVICIQPLGAPAMTRSWRARRVVTTDSTSTIADGVAGRRPIPAVLDDLLLVADDAVLVQEESIIAGMRMLLDHAGLVVEPSAALGIAAILEDRERFAGRHVVTIVCGSNVDVDAYRRWVGAAPAG
jgi:threonine dehydratase